MAELDPADLFKLLKELGELNENLRNTKQATLTLCSNLKDIATHTKAIYALAKQVNILNQIMLQIGKKEGTAAMFSKLLDAVAVFAKHAR